MFKPYNRLPPLTATRPDLWRASMRAGEDNDCTVISLAHALDVSYDIAHGALALAGRKRCDGIFLAQKYPAAARLLGFDCVFVGPSAIVRDWKSPTVGAFIKRHGNKKDLTCVIRTNEHAIGFRDCIIADAFGVGLGTRMEGLVIFARRPGRLLTNRKR